MAGCLYFFPGRDSGMPHEDIVRAGVGYALHEKGGHTPCHVGNSPAPNSVPGLVLAPAGFEGRKVGYFEDQQTWRRVPKSDAWVGFYNDARPEPADLLRDQPLPGYSVTLGDGQDWIAPVALAHSVLDGQCVEGMNLPSRISVDDDGVWQREGVIPKYAALWSAAEKFWSQFLVQLAGEDEKIEMNTHDLYDWALCALSANYRLGKAEVALLGLFDDQIVAHVLRVLIDWEVIVEWHNKKKIES